MAVRRGSAGPGGRGPRETRVDRTLPAPGHAPAGAPVGSRPAAERQTGTKRGGAARTERPCPPGEASTTGAAQRALALEPRSFRYAYRAGHAARCRDVARSLENRMETTASVPQTREDGALSLRTSRIGGTTVRIARFAVNTGLDVHETYPAALHLADKSVGGAVHPGLAFRCRYAGGRNHFSSFMKHHEGVFPGSPQSLALERRESP